MYVNAIQTRGKYELLFRPLYEGHVGYAFPCDEGGQVDMDAMNDRLRNTYLYARALIGREVAHPVVRSV
jgi:hypothetical protein